MIESIKTLITDSSVHSIVAAYLAIATSIYVFRSGNNFTLIKERHDNLIFPLFNVLEPVLYKSNHDKELETALKIIEENKFLADGKLLELHYYCSNYSDENNFQELCMYIDRAYDKSCSKLHLKKRSLFYRLNRKQYKNHFQLSLFTSILLLKYIIGLVACISIFLVFMVLINYLFENDMFFEAILLFAVIYIPMYVYSNNQ